MDEGLLSIISASCGQLVKMRITLEPHGVFDYLYLRNLLTHTVNNLLQTLNNVKIIQCFVVKQKSNIIHIMCENFITKPWVLYKLQLI